MKKRHFSNPPITEGNLFTSILLYSVPIMLTSLISTLFNAADLIVIGHFAPLTVISSVGLTSPIVSLAVGSFLGLAGGTNAVLARYLGAKNHEKIEKTVSTSILFAFAVGLVLMAVAVPCTVPLLNLIRCPAENLPYSRLYLTIYFIGIPSMMVYNFGSSILRADGDSTRPLIYLLGSGLLNVVLNYLFCVILEEKVAAVAIATTASQTLGAVLVLIRLSRIDDDCRIRWKHLAWDFKVLGTVLRFGVPCALTGSLYSVSNMQVQAAFNGFGDAIIAGNTAASNVENIIDGTAGAFGMAALVFAGQNFGAGQTDRVRKSTRISLLYAVIIGLVLGFGVWGLGHPILSIYLPGEEEAIAAGVLRMKFLETTYFICSVYYILTKVMAALGYSTLPAILMAVSILGFRFVWVTFIFPLNPTLTMLFLCYPLSWTLTFLIQGVLFLIVWTKFLRGKIAKV